MIHEAGGRFGSNLSIKLLLRAPHFLCISIWSTAFMRRGCAVAQMQKQMRILENRLEKTYHKYSSRKLQIGSLRDHIDNLRRERLVFDDVHRKLEKGLASEKREMGAIILQSNMSHEGRERVRALPSHLPTGALWIFSVDAARGVKTT